MFKLNATIVEMQFPAQASLYIKHYIYIKHCTATHKPHRTLNID